jgi:ATP-dependent Clp protease ATP-binding subunit ClpB
LKRALQREIETPLGKLLLKGEITDGSLVVASRDSGRGGLEFTVKPGAGSKGTTAAEAA